MRTIHFYGDSWTKGDGCQFEPGSGRIESSIKFGPDYTKEYAEYSMPAQVKKLLNNEFNIINNGSSGSSNFQIYGQILKGLSNNTFSKNDIVIVNWTSIIREPFTFMFTPETLNHNPWEGHGIDNSLRGHWSENEWTPFWITDISNPRMKKIFKSIFEDFIIDRINYDIFYEICMNYVCNLEIIFKELEVNFLFMNAFENIISENVSFYSKINKENWIRFGSSFSEYLHEIESTLDLSVGYSVWEDDYIKPGVGNDGPHPNRIGYKYIADLICEELKFKKII